MPIFFFLVFLMPLAAVAQPTEIIVEAAPIDESRIEPSRSFSVVPGARARESVTVAEALRSVPGLEVVRQGGLGQTTSVFIRGARAEDTLVLIDGMEANDSMSPASGFDFATLSTENIERIEIYRGPQSVRFGAGALGGVVNIVTKEGRGLSRIGYLGEIGSFGSNKIALSSSGQRGDLGYALGVDRLFSAGFSAASESSGNTEPDQAEIASVSGKVNWRPGTSSSAEATLRYTKSRADIDRQGGVGGDDPNDSTNASQLVSGLQVSRRFFEDRLKSSLGLFFSEVDRAGRNRPDASNAIDTNDHFLSETRKIESNHELSIGEPHVFRLGLQWREESGASDSIYNGAIVHFERQTQSITGESLTYFYESSLWFGDIGTRFDQSSLAGSINSQRVSVGRLMFDSSSKFFGSYGTGFKLPSLFQLFSVYGDTGLHQESSQSFEVTFEQKFARSNLASVTYFENFYRDLIDFDTAANRYFNVSRARSKGAELYADVELVADLVSSLRLSGSYNYLDSVDENTGLGLVRRPFNAFTVGLRYASPRYNVFAVYRFKGERPDIDPATFTRLTSSSYAVWNLGGSYALGSGFKISGRVENLLNARYEEVAGYGTPGVSFYASLSGEI